MAWLHCNQCFTRRRAKFALSSCGHILCEACIKSKQCSVCGASCGYLPITEKMKPHEKIFFKDPVELIQSQLEHISQIALFQQMQKERVITHLKHKSAELERSLKEGREQAYRQLSELKRENADLKKQLSELKRETDELKKTLCQRRFSPGQFQRNSTQRMSLPVAVAFPVSPHSGAMDHFGSAEQQGWVRDRAPSLSPLATPGQASISSHSSFHEHRTPSSFSSPARIQRQTPNAFHFNFLDRLSIQSPQH